MIRIRRLFVLLAAVGLCLAAAGCASPDAEADLPWNMPQSWESSPAMPFGTAGSY